MIQITFHEDLSITTEFDPPPGVNMLNVLQALAISTRKFINSLPEELHDAALTQVLLALTPPEEGEVFD